MLLSPSIARDVSNFEFSYSGICSCTSILFPFLFSLHRALCSLDDFCPASPTDLHRRVLTDPQHAMRSIEPHQRRPSGTTSFRLSWSLAWSFRNFLALLMTSVLATSCRAQDFPSGSRHPDEEVDVWHNPKRLYQQPPFPPDSPYYPPRPPGAAGGGGYDEDEDGYVPQYPKKFTSDLFGDSPASGTKDCEFHAKNLTVDLSLFGRLKWAR